MKFFGIEENYFKIKLDRPLKNSKRRYVNREGFFITLSLDTYKGLGEVAPLPGFSTESLDESLWAIEQLIKTLKKGSNYKSKELFELFKLFRNDTPCLNFALDIALCDILSQIKKVPIGQHINKNFLNKINFSSMNKSSIKENNIIKVKFGIDDIKSEINHLKKIQSNLPNNVCYRVDANNAYNVKDAIYLLNELKEFNVEYVEEPLSNMSIDNLKKIKKISSLNIALDESIIANNYKELISSGLIKYVIFKASLFGSIEKIQKLNQYLVSHDVNLVLSSALHSPIGNMSNIHVASFLELNNKHGLNNFMFYDYTKGSVPYKNNSTFVDLSSIIGLGVNLDN